MRLVDHWTTTGDAFFRNRSWIPLLLVPFFLASFIGMRYPFRSHALGLGWEIGCFLIALVGIALRVYTTGTSPRGTSGRNTRNQKASTLNITGPYSIVRHPLYLANFLIAVGLSLFPRAWFLPIIVSLATVLYYERIAAREEAFLDERFGADFRRWAETVPAAIPSFKTWCPPARAFDWRRALDREFYVVSEVAVAFFVLDIMEDYSAHHRLELDPVWTTMGTLGVLLFAVMWTRKKLRRRAH
jgi:protein-S-isoprenylcysteine O-methyltransferase Ste14